MPAPSTTILALLLAACAGPPRAMRLEDWMRVGVSLRDEAARERATLEAAGWETTAREESGSFVALAFRRGEQRAVRIVSSRGIVVALDSQGPGGLLARQGSVSLLEREDPDAGGVDRPEVIVARDEGGVRCLTFIRIDEGGFARAMADDAGALQEGACVGRLEDVDGDGRPEAIVTLRWPELAIGDEVPTLDVTLAERGAAWRAGAMPVVYVERERARRREALEAARRRRDVGQTLKLGVELAALAHLGGAALAAQVRRFDEALSGLVLSEAERDRVSAVRRVIAAGWRSPAP